MSEAYCICNYALYVVICIAFARPQKAVHPKLVTCSVSVNPGQVTAVIWSQTSVVMMTCFECVCISVDWRRNHNRDTEQTSMLMMMKYQEESHLSD